MWVPGPGHRDPAPAPLGPSPCSVCSCIESPACYSLLNPTLGLLELLSSLMHRQRLKCLGVYIQRAPSPTPRVIVKDWRGKRYCIKAQLSYFKLAPTLKHNLCSELPCGIRPRLSITVPLGSSFMEWTLCCATQTPSGLKDLSCLILLESLPFTGGHIACVAQGTSCPGTTDWYRVRSMSSGVTLPG